MLILYLRVRSCNLGLVMLYARPYSYVRTRTRGAHLEDGDALPGGQLPHPHRLVPAPARQMRAVGAVRHALDISGVSLRPTIHPNPTRPFGFPSQTQLLQIAKKRGPALTRLNQKRRCETISKAVKYLHSTECNVLGTRVRYTL